MNIAIVGAGTGGKKIMDLFHTVDGVSIVTVVDKNLHSEGIALAKSYGLNCTDDMTGIDSRAEVIIEATGIKSVYDQLTALYEGKAQIVGSDVAKLMMHIVDKQTTTTERLNYQIEEIHRTSAALHEEMNEIIRVTDRLGVINQALIASSDESKRFIAQSDEMIKAVNKLTQQIKILGLNANIEAARAGEHGRGFSVVATEVQKMSDSTSHFANQIGELLSALNSENEKISGEVTRLNEIANDQAVITDRTRKIANQLNEL